jgi:hypothetical protein
MISHQPVELIAGVLAAAIGAKVSWLPTTQL